jgi:glutamine amidotransferase
VIIATGGANIASLQFALERLGADSRVSADPTDIRRAARVILPGVGAAADAMQRLRSSGLDTVIPALTQPVLGICLGMQLLHGASDEGVTACLGVIPGRAQRFADALERPVPHMGWNTIEIEGDCALLDGLDTGSYAYFVHSYALPRPRRSRRRITASPSPPPCNGRTFPACNFIPSDRPRSARASCKTS